MPPFTSIAQSIYSITNRIGLMDYAIPQKLFVSSYFAYKRLVEDPFAVLTSAHPELFAGGHVLDVGANVGYTAAVFSEVVQSPYRVYAFEPETRNVEILKRSVSQEGQSARVIPVQCAVGAHEGTVQLWINARHHADHRVITDNFRSHLGQVADTQNVRLMSIDSFCNQTIPGEPVSFVKIDVQGYEENVVLGMQQTIAQNPRLSVALEYFPEGMAELGFKPTRLLEMLKNQQFEMYQLDRRGLKPIAMSVLEQLRGPQGYVDLLFSKSLPKVGVRP